MGVSDPFYRLVHFPAVTLRVADVETVAGFYESVLGFVRAPGRDGMVELSAPDASTPLIVLNPVPDAPPRPGGTAGLFHVAFLYPDRSALGRVLARLVRTDVALGAADHGVSEALYLSDPEGNGIELAADRAPSVWPPPRPDGQVAMVSEALDASGLVEAGSASDGPLLPPDVRIGHVHLSVSSLDRAEAFYSGALGFAVRQRDYPGARFFARDGYHHHFGVNTWQSRTPVAAGTRGLQHIDLAFASSDTWRSVVELARDGGYLDRVEGSNAILRDPDGIDIHVRSMEAL